MVFMRGESNLAVIALAPRYCTVVDRGDISASRRTRDAGYVVQTALP